MNPHVRRQVERILDQDASTVHSVIVQMEEATDQLEPLLGASAEAVRRRHLTISARDLAPPEAELIREQRDLTSSERRRLREVSTSMASQVALASVETVALRSLRSAGIGALRPLLTSHAVKDAKASAARRSKRELQSGESPPGFGHSWSSRSAVLRMTRDELAALPDSVPNISGVFSNDHISLPPPVEVKNMPHVVAENSTSTWGVSKVGALSVWGAYGTRGKPSSGRPVRVAVLDTGVDPDHPELRGKLKRWAEFDENGDQVNSDPHDSGEHGTHVCGTIAGGRADSPSREHPFIGLAPDAELMVGLVLKGGRGTYFQIVAGLDWAIENGAEVINMSLGGVAFQPDVLDVYTRSILSANTLGIPVVISIGNEGAQTSGAPGNDYFALAVGATDYMDRPAGFSGGRTQIVRQSRFIRPEYLPLIYSKPDLTAPGVAVRSCVPNGGYGTWNGTSMAAPHVAGAIALLMAATDIRSIPAERRAFVIQDLIASSVEELGEAGRDHRYGLGRLDALRAIGFAKDRGY